MNISDFGQISIDSSVSDPGSDAFLTPGSGMGRKSASGSGIQDEKPGSYFLELRNNFFWLKYFNSLMRIRDLGWRQFVSGMEKSRIRNKHPGSATLLNRIIFHAIIRQIFTVVV
jgi:hypothetical protein